VSELTLSRNESAGGANAPAKPLMKGRQTRAAILEAALKLASHMGLEGLSIGALAEVTEMSKSGVFAHFGSREELQISVVREYHAKFEEEVFAPALREPRGLPRLRALFERWVRRVSAEIDSGCIYISGAVEFDDRPGPVRDALVAMVKTWQQALDRAIRAAVAEGHLRADTDPAQVLFELHGLVLALHHDARFLRNPSAAAQARAGFERLIAHCTTPAGKAGRSSAATRKSRDSAASSPSA
jgi:AcrR family transcriptional regulator